MAFATFLGLAGIASSISQFGDERVVATAIIAVVCGIYDIVALARRET